MEETARNHRPVAVIAFGGNALLRPQDHGTQEEQITLAWKATRWLVEIIQRGYELVMVHGNGPQVGNIMIQVEEAVTKIPPQTLDVCGAQTQGSMGYMLANQLRNRFNEEQLNKPIVAMLSEVVVGRDDPAFENPAKPVGPYFTSYRANMLMQELGWQMVEDSGRGWRKVVPSPTPIEILGIDVMTRLIHEMGAVLIAGGGGGIPVYRDVGGYYRGVEAVIDKDYTASLIAQHLDADLYIVLTQVPMVAENFGRTSQRWLRKLPAAKAQEMLEANQFPAGSMGPKIRSALEFVERTGKEVLITDAEHLKAALAGESGTFIVADGDVEVAPGLD
jgi:carbamate kinase